MKDELILLVCISILGLALFMALPESKIIHINKQIKEKSILQ